MKNKTITQMILNALYVEAAVTGWILWKLKKQLWRALIIFIVVTGATMALSIPVAHAPKAVAAINEPLAPLSSEQDAYIFTYATKYANPAKGKTVSFLRYQLACLAFKENGYHSNDHCGDGGLACGEYQFHPATYTAFRQIMIKDGLTDHMGSRLNDQDATETTAWAITHGHESDWGPLLRGECY